MQRMERNLHGMRHNSPGILLFTEWSKQKLKHRHVASLEAGFTKPKAAFEPAAYSIGLLLETRYHYQRQIITGQQGTFYAGGWVGAHYNLAFYPNWDESHMYWANFAGLGFSTHWQKQLTGTSKHVFADVSLPLLGGISRPPLHRDYKIEDTAPSAIIKTNHKDMQLAGPAQYFNPNLKLGLQLNTTSRLACALYYQANYIHATTTYSNPYKQIRHGIGIRATI
jgi:hypothetical protein